MSWKCCCKRSDLTNFPVSAGCVSHCISLFASHKYLAADLCSHRFLPPLSCLLGWCWKQVQFATSLAVAALSRHTTMVLSQSARCMSTLSALYDTDMRLDKHPSQVQCCSCIPIGCTYKPEAESHTLHKKTECLASTCKSIVCRKRKVYAGRRG